MTIAETTNLPDGLMGCGCAACRSATTTETNPSLISSDYISSSSPTEAEAYLLSSGYKWGTTSLNFKFLTSLPSYYTSSYSESHNFQTFNTQMQDATNRILDQLESFTNLHFTETSNTNSAQLTFAQAQLPSNAGAWAYYPSSNPLGGDVWTNNYYSATQNPSEGNYGFYTLLHEIGHALGLEHSFTAGLTGDENTSRYTVMAYDWSPFYSSSYMIYDIAALQNLYGVNMSYETGDNIYVLDGSKAYSIWDAGGVDTLDASAHSISVTLDLRDGEYSSVGMTRNIGIAFDAIIENATGGSGHDKLIGNDANNILTGNNGNDTFIASGGNDTILGGNGIDILVYDFDISNFFISVIDSITVMIQDLTGFYNTDHVIGVETFEFLNMDFSFANLEAISAIGGTSEVVETIGIRTYTSNGQWTILESRFLGSETHGANDFRYRNTDDLITVNRSRDINGIETLDISVDDTLSSLVKSVRLYHDSGIDIINVSDARQVVLDVRGMDHDFTASIDQGLYTVIKTGVFNDTVTIDNVLDVSDRSSHKIYTGDGDDTVTLTSSSGYALAYIDGGSGDDIIDLSAFDGRSTKIFGRDGDDFIITGSSNDRVYGDNGNDFISTGAGNDFILDRVGINHLNGGDGDDRLYGNGTLIGGAGNDRLYGYTSDDVLLGGGGNDVISGHNGNDAINGGDGFDILYGGRGADLFSFDNLNNVDFVQDFNKLEDRLDVSSLLVGFDPSDDAITDFLQITTVGRSTFLQIDVDGSVGGSHFVDLARINGLKGADLDDMLDNLQIMWT
ncbi:MAG: M10 family metallopeptidase C-terminal domain-containing protein [Alphaproteobacteria bacterium]|nr:M10 family metallopeptidase C-terminal domain-containing protein [Alphaproteobacteria bacterium]MCB9985780.1 M10 family metallopeptidase C-terminal domain-containing protein [Micavibrio sp.]HRK97588.1 M10 family metallopeptidase C-terminal domain-containing protein [Alphaproteobacteria bacterium]